MQAGIRVAASSTVDLRQQLHQMIEEVTDARARTELHAEIDSLGETALAAALHAMQELRSSRADNQATNDAARSSEASTQALCHTLRALAEDAREGGA
jgi:hypothetical protein